MQKLDSSLVGRGFFTPSSSIITGHETWLYYYDYASKFQSKVWPFGDREPPTMI